MSVKPNQESTETIVQCSTCRKEIPKSAAMVPENVDYVEHFCGQDCYDQFFAEKDSRKAAE
jgi:hypothetical protein